MISRCYCFAMSTEQKNLETASFNLTPADPEELRVRLRECNSRKEYVLTGAAARREEYKDRVDNLNRLIDAGVIEAKSSHFLDLKRLNQINEHVVEDMVVSVQTGITIKELDEYLERSNQWLPVQGTGVDSTLLELVESDDGGPLETGYGGMRSLVLGLNSALATGQELKSGGKIVKNVTGYDLGKLLIGTHSWLAITHSAHLRLFARPELTTCLKIPVHSASKLNTLVKTACHSGLPISAFEVLSPEMAETKSYAVAYIFFQGQKEEVEKSAEVLHSLLQPISNEMTIFEGAESEALLQALANPRKQSDRSGNLSKVSVSTLPQNLENALEDLKGQLGTNSVRLWSFRPAMGRLSCFLDRDCLESLHQIAPGYDAFLPGTGRYPGRSCYKNEDDRVVISDLVGRVKQKFDPFAILNPLVRF